LRREGPEGKKVLYGEMIQGISIFDGRDPRSPPPGKRSIIKPGKGPLLDRLRERERNAFSRTKTRKKKRLEGLLREKKTGSYLRLRVGGRRFSAGHEVLILAVRRGKKGRGRSSGIPQKISHLKEKKERTCPRKRVLKPPYQNDKERKVPAVGKSVPARGRKLWRLHGGTTN